MKRIISLIVVMSFFVSSCASIYNAGSQTILAKSADNKEGVDVEITTSTGAYAAKLPATIVAESSYKGVEIKLTDKCYEPTVLNVNKNITPSFWTNFLLFYGFPFGMLIDAGTGNMWKYDSNVMVHSKNKCN